MLEKVIAELSSTQSELVGKERLAAVGEVVVKMKHDINNPLSIIISYADLIAMDCGDQDGELNEQINKIKDAAYRISDLTKALDKLESAATEEYLEGISMLKTD
jgi:phosphoglycerate-specific signal transduction histidine kinase